MGELQVTLASGKLITESLVYGKNIRSSDDVRSCSGAFRADGKSVLQLDLGVKPIGVQQVRISQNNAYSGIKLCGVTLIAD